MFVFVLTILLAVAQTQIAPPPAPVPSSSNNTASSNSSTTNTTTDSPPPDNATTSSSLTTEPPSTSNTSTSPAPPKVTPTPPTQNPVPVVRCSTKNPVFTVYVDDPEFANKDQFEITKMVYMKFRIILSHVDETFKVAGTYSPRPTPAPPTTKPPSTPKPLTPAPPTTTPPVPYEMQLFLKYETYPCDGKSPPTTAPPRTTAPPKGVTPAPTQPKTKFMFSVEISNVTLVDRLIRALLLVQTKIYPFEISNVDFRTSVDNMKGVTTSPSYTLDNIIVPVLFGTEKFQQLQESQKYVTSQVIVFFGLGGMLMGVFVGFFLGFFFLSPTTGHSFHEFEILASRDLPVRPIGKPRPAGPQPWDSPKRQRPRRPQGKKIRSSNSNSNAL